MKTISSETTRRSPVADSLRERSCHLRRHSEISFVTVDRTFRAVPPGLDEEAASRGFPGLYSLQRANNVLDRNHATGCGQGAAGLGSPGHDHHWNPGRTLRLMPVPSPSSADILAGRARCAPYPTVRTDQTARFEHHMIHRRSAHRCPLI